jgi:diguanylate cyclase (GGDEF)-like protein
MDTQTLVIVLVAINVVIATGALLIPWLRARRERFMAPATGGANGSAARPAAAGNATTNTAGAAARTASALAATTAPGAGGPDAAAPWVSERAAGTGGSERADGAEPARPPMDAGTGLDLPGAWTRWLDEEDARVQRFHRPATVVLVELAGLDRLAERLGEEAAARLIPPIATTLRRDARATDHLARLDEARFAALLPETTEVQAIHYVERVRSACDVWLEAGAVSLRLSIGWAEINPTRRANLAVLDAERRLFAEREKARSQLARADDEPPAEMPVLQPTAAGSTRA